MFLEIAITAENNNALLSGLPTNFPISPASPFLQTPLSIPDMHNNP
jgi:hypothetical protein